MQEKWWEKSISKRVYFLNHNYCNLISMICSKVIRSYPQMPIDTSDLYNIVLYKLGQEIIFYRQSIPIKKYLSRRITILAKNQSKGYLTKKYEILNKAIFFKDYMWKNSSIDSYDNDNKEYEIDSSKLDKLEKKIFDYFYVHNHNMIETIKHLKITRYILKDKIKKISQKIIIKAK